MNEQQKNKIKELLTNLIVNSSGGIDEGISVIYDHPYLTDEEVVQQQADFVELRTVLYSWLKQA